MENRGQQLRTISKARTQGGTRHRQHETHIPIRTWPSIHYSSKRHMRWRASRPRTGARRGATRHPCRHPPCASERNPWRRPRPSVGRPRLDTRP